MGPPASQSNVSSPPSSPSHDLPTINELKIPILNSPKQENSPAGAPLTPTSPSQMSMWSSSQIPYRLRPVTDLPDLTQHLIEQGIYAEYTSWRDNYFKWRKGEAKGAKGENSHEHHLEKKQGTDQFQFWYPNVSCFTFRRTCSYWVGVTFAEGAFLFAMSPMMTIAFEHNMTNDMAYAMTKAVNLSGGVFFTVGAYLGYFELINMDVDVENGQALNYCWCDWLALTKNLGLPWSGVIGWIVYVSGAFMYQFCLAAVCFSMSEMWYNILFAWPYLIAGFAFFIGGVCQVVQNRVLCSAPTTLVWWVSTLNLIGGIGYWLAACPNLMGSTLATDFVGWIGSICYLVGALLMLIMWRGEQFGLSLISVLNSFTRDKGTKIAVRKDLRTGHDAGVVALNGGPHSPQHTVENLQDVVNPALSWRGLTFVTVYILCGGVQVLMCCAAAALLSGSDTAHEIKGFLTSLFGGLVNLVAVHMILALNSACVRVPQEQPYRILFIMTRVLMLLTLANSVLLFDVNFEDGMVQHL